MIGLAMLGTALSALVFPLAQSLPITLIGAMLSGASWTAATIGLFGIFVESTHDVPNADLTRYTTIYHQLIFVAAFIGPMIGSSFVFFGSILVLGILFCLLFNMLAGWGFLSVDSLG